MIEIKRILNKKTKLIAIFALCFCMSYFAINCMETDGMDSFRTFNYNTDEYAEYIEGYKDYIKNIVESAEKTKKFPVFSDDKFVVDNIEKTYSDYAGLIEVQPVVTNTLGFNKYITYIPVISTFVFFIILYCIFNTQKEYENGEIVISYSTKNGRFILAFKRNVIYLLVAVGLNVIFNFLIGILSGLLYGFPDFSVPIQSSMLFKNCTARLSIWEFCLISILKTGVGISVLTLFANLMFNVIRNKYISIVVSGILFFGEYQLSLLAQNNSLNKILANINIFKLIDFSAYYRNYQNINISGSAVSSLKMMTAVTIVLFILFLFGSAIAYTYRRPFSKIRFGKVKDYFEVQIGKLHSHCNFLSFELYKIFIRKKRLLFIIILIFVEVLLIKGTIVEFPERQRSMDDTYSQYGGEDWERFENYLKEYRNEMENRENEIARLQSQATEGNNREIINKIYKLSADVNEMQKILVEYDEVVSRKNAIKEQTGKLIYAMSDRGYNEIFGSNSVIREAGIMIIMSLIVVLLGAGYYLEETQSGFIALLRSSEQGVKETYNKKLRLIMAAVFILLLILLCIDYININRLYGFKYLNAPVISLKFMGTEVDSLFAGMRIWQYLLLDILLKITVCMTSLAITLLCSLKFKTLFFVPIVVFLTALCGSLSLYAGITVKVVLVTIMIIFLACAISYIARGKYSKFN